MSRKILIIGFEPTGRREGLRVLRRGGFELWTFNNDHELLSKSQRHFEMHELAAYGLSAVDDAVPDDRYLHALEKGVGCPVYHLREDERIAGSVAYPIAEMVRRFGGYFTNSFSYMLALAIHERADEIHLYGVDMAREHEHAWERPSIEYFLGWAKGAGIKVVIPDSSDLLKCIGLYGYGRDNPYEVEAQVRAYRDTLQVAVRASERNAAKITGVLEDIEYWLRSRWLPGDPGKATSHKVRARKRWLLSRHRYYEKLGKRYETPVIPSERKKKRRAA